MEPMCKLAVSAEHLARVPREGEMGGTTLPLVGHVLVACSGTKVSGI